MKVRMYNLYESTCWTRQETFGCFLHVMQFLLKRHVCHITIADPEQKIGHMFFARLCRCVLLLLSQHNKCIEFFKHFMSIVTFFEIAHSLLEQNLPKHLSHNLLAHMPSSSRCMLKVNLFVQVFLCFLALLKLGVLVAFYGFHIFFDSFTCKSSIFFLVGAFEKCAKRKWKWKCWHVFMPTKLNKNINYKLLILTLKFFTSFWYSDHVGGFLYSSIWCSELYMD